MRRRSGVGSTSSESGGTMKDMRDSTCIEANTSGDAARIEAARRRVSGFLGPKPALRPEERVPALAARAATQKGRQ